MLSAVTERATWSGVRLSRIAAVSVALWALLYLWPLADGSTADGFSSVDHLLRVAATAAASGAALLAALRARPGLRWPWACLALGANVWAGTQAVRWGYELSQPGSAPSDLAEFGYVAFALGAVVALGRLVAEWAPPLNGRQVLDTALLVSPVVLISWSTGLGTVLDQADGSTSALVQLVSRLLIDVALVAATCGLLSQRSARSPASVLLGAGLVAIAVADTALIALTARGETVPDRVVGVVLCATLTVLALGIVAGTAPVAPSIHDGLNDDGGSPSSLPSLLPAASALVVLGTVIAGEGLDWLEVAFLVTLGTLTLLRQQLVAREAEERLRQVSNREAEMRHLAFHDELTGLANRALFHDRLERSLALHRRYRRPLVVLFCDLDDFKAVNDAHGHFAGDEMLRELAARLSTTLRPTDTFARLGGDEFAVLLEDDADAAAVVRRMRSALDSPFFVTGRAVTVGMTIGIARVDAADKTPDADGLLATADADMYAAKRSSPGRRLVPMQEAPAPAAVSSQAAPAESVLDAFARDLRAGRIDVVYQPLVDPATGAVRGLEALARWSHAGEPVLPRTFIPLAVRGGLIAALTDLMLDRACAQVRAWSRALGHDELTMSVNIAAEQLLDRDFPARVSEALARHGVCRDQLVLEITSAALVEDAVTAYAVSKLLREAGVLLSLSELGEDPVALGHLHRLPLDSIKVDGDGADVVIDIGAEERVVRAFQSLARELDLRMVVEQVERADQLAVLRRIGGMLVQGFLLARPAPAAQLDEMVLHGLRMPD